MLRRVLALASILVLVACGQRAGSGSPLATATPTDAPASSPTPAATATPAPKAFDSPRGKITVEQPRAFSRVSSPLRVSGSVNAFEATFLWRILDLSGKELAKGFGTAADGMSKSAFSVQATYSVGGDTYGYVEISVTTPRDGSTEDAALVPVTLGGSGAAALTPAPKGLASARGWITTDQPRGFARVTSPLAIVGTASVFEASVSWRILDLAGKELARGFTTASEGAPGRGTYSIQAPFAVSADTLGYAEVLVYSARDGSVDEAVRVPVTLAAK
jgi:hypothetical protein